MSDEQERRPRTWGPMAAAGGVAAVVLLGAVGWSIVAGVPRGVDAAAIEACEAEYAASGGPAIVGGDVYETNEFAEYYAVAQTHGEVPTPLDDVTEAEREQWADAAAAYDETGDGAVVVVWRLEDDAYRQCVLPVSGGEVDPGAAVVNELGIASEN